MLFWLRRSGSKGFSDACPQPAQTAFKITTQDNNFLTLLGSVHMSPATLVLISVGQFFLCSCGCFHPTSMGKKLFSSHLTGTKLTNKHGAVCFDTGGYTWYYDWCHPSELINVELTSTILQSTTSGTNKDLNRQNIPISVMRVTRSYGKFSSHFTEIPTHARWDLT